MVGDIFKHLLQWLSTPIRGMGVLVLTSTVLFALYWKGKLPTDNFLRGLLLVALLSTFGLATYPLEHGWKAFAKRRSGKKMEQKIFARLQHLTPEESRMLRAYIEQRRTTVSFAPYEGVVEVLAKDGILHLIAHNPDAHVLLSDTYTIDPIAWRHLNAHPDLIGLTAI